MLSKPIPAPRLPAVKLPAVRLPARRRPSATVTGLEIGATQAIAAQARVHEGAITAERVASRVLPPGLLRDGIVLEPDGLAHELKALFNEHRFAKRVRVGLATPRTILRVIDLPPLPDRDIPAALRMQAQEQIPMPLDRAVMDYRAVGLVDTPTGQRLRLVVVVTERDGVNRLLEALRRAGLKTVGIDLSMFALIRALHDHQSAQGPVLYANLGDLTNIAIAETGVCRFTRLAPHGLSTLLGRLADQHGIPTDQALALVRQAGGGLRGGDVSEHQQALGDLLARTATELGTELRTAAEFYSTQFGAGPVATGVVAGPLAPLPGFIDAVAAASGLELRSGEVSVANPGALRDLDARLASLACGLAVEELDR
ncbi:MAG: pilus assembly protein PilM [Solirubrobacteraceae bacterium]